MKVTPISHIIRVVLALNVIFTAQSARAEQEGDFTYSLKDGAVTITKYTGDAGNIKIPAKIAGLPVQAIGNAAFMNAQAATIAIPDGVTEIQEAAFANCTNLANATIPPSVLSIGKVAFGNCRKLTQLTLPAKVKSLGFEAFSRCTSLTTVTFEGNAPALDNIRNAPALFFQSAPNFTIRYHKGSIGFTTPEWNGYKTVEIAQTPNPK